MCFVFEWSLIWELQHSQPSFKCCPIFYFIKWLPWFPLFFRETQVQVAHYKPVACACLWLLARKHWWPYFCFSCSSAEVTWGTLIFFSLRRFPFHRGNEFLPINVISVKVKGIIDQHPGLDNFKIKNYFLFLLYSHFGLLRMYYFMIVSQPQTLAPMITVWCLTIFVVFWWLPVILPKDDSVIFEFVIIYSTSCHSKPLWLFVLYRLQKEMLCRMFMLFFSMQVNGGQRL